MYVFDMCMFDIIRKEVRSEKFKFRITWRSQYRLIQHSCGNLEYAWSRHFLVLVVMPLIMICKKKYIMSVTVFFHELFHFFSQSTLYNFWRSSWPHKTCLWIYYLVIIIVTVKFVLLYSMFRKPVFAIWKRK